MPADGQRRVPPWCGPRAAAAARIVPCCCRRDIEFSGEKLGLLLSFRRLRAWLLRKSENAWNSLNFGGKKPDRKDVAARSFAETRIPHRSVPVWEEQ
jgi:hypothetical protein